MWAAMPSLRVQPQMCDLEYAAIRAASARTRSKFRLTGVLCERPRWMPAALKAFLFLLGYRVFVVTSLLGVALVQPDVIESFRDTAATRKGLVFVAQDFNLDKTLGYALQLHPVLIERSTQTCALTALPSTHPLVKQPAALGRFFPFSSRRNCLLFL